MQKTLPYRLIVTSGPTREWIDPVRFISNPASGQTGWHLAVIGKQLFEEVIYIVGPTYPPFDKFDNAKNISVETTKEMQIAVHNSISDNCILIMAAAPADYAPKQKAKPHKISKKLQHTELHLHLAPTIDILKSLIPVAAKYSQFYRIGYAAETQNIIEHAYEKLQEKQLDLICANEVNKTMKGFGNNLNKLIILEKNGNKNFLGPASKKALAASLLDMVIDRFINTPST